MAGKAQDKGHRDADSHTSAVFPDHFIKDAGETNDGIGNNIVQQNDSNRHDEACGIAYIIQTEQQLDGTVDKGCGDAPLPSPAVTDQDKGKHAGNCYAATEGKINLQQAEHSAQGDQDSTLGQFTGQVLIHVFSSFFRFRGQTKIPHAQ